MRKRLVQREIVLPESLHPIFKELVANGGKLQLAFKGGSISFFAAGGSQRGK